MIQYERIESYIEGKKRYTNFQDKAALDKYLQPNKSDLGKPASEGSTIFGNQKSLLGDRNGFAQRDPMPFEVSGMKITDMKAESTKRVSCVKKSNEQLKRISNTNYDL